MPNVSVYLDSPALVLNYFQTQRSLAKNICQFFYGREYLGFFPEVLQRESRNTQRSWCLSKDHLLISQFSSVQSLSRVRLFVIPWIAARQASLSITNSQSSLRLMPIESVMPSSHLIPCHPLLLLPPVPPSIRVFSNESTLHMRWPKYQPYYVSINCWD